MVALEYLIAAVVLVLLAYLFICGLVVAMWVGELLFELFRKQEDRDGIRGKDS